MEDVNLCIILPAEDLEIPDYQDELLLLHFKTDLIRLMESSKITFFGYAPDNTADGNDELLTDGIFFRLIAPDVLLNLTLESSLTEVRSAFINLIKNEPLFWGTVIIERGFIKTETTIEFLFK